MSRRPTQRHSQRAGPRVYGCEHATQQSYRGGGRPWMRRSPGVWTQQPTRQARRPDNRVSRQPARWYPSHCSERQPTRHAYQQTAVVRSVHAGHIHVEGVSPDWKRGCHHNQTGRPCGKHGRRAPRVPGYAIQWNAGAHGSHQHVYPGAKDQRCTNPTQTDQDGRARLRRRWRGISGSCGRTRACSGSSWNYAYPHGSERGHVPMHVPSRAACTAAAWRRVPAHRRMQPTGSVRPRKGCFGGGCDVTTLAEGRRHEGRHPQQRGTHETRTVVTGTASCQQCIQPGAPPACPYSHSCGCSGRRIAPVGRAWSSLTSRTCSVMSHTHRRCRQREGSPHSLQQPTHQRWIQFYVAVACAVWQVGGAADVRRW
jgi:hypothetical protein